jgi:hypothetical protein
MLDRALARLLLLTLVGCTDAVDGKETGSGGTETDIDTETAIELDADADGFLASAGDCDDTNPAVNPDADERCNGRDDDCDDAVDEGATDAGTWYGDGDGDGYGVEQVAVTACEAPSTAFVAVAGDCDDGDAAAYPGADEACGDTVDFNCDGSVGYADADGDGIVACEDCDDTDATAYPGAAEACDGVDDDCDGSVDEDAADAPLWYTDADGDAYGDDATTVASCDQPAGTSAVGGDCDDADDAWHPGAAETCAERVDYNCDGSVGGDDLDGDGTAACDDCDDTDALAFPGGAEVCGGADEDCDGEIDEAGASGEVTWYADADADTYGDGRLAVLACGAVEGFVADATDCDDDDATIHPGAAEVCDDAEIDEDCDGDVNDADGSLDEASASTWHIDYDGDGYGVAGTFDARACEAPPNYVADATDCDDRDETISPGAVEACDDADTDEDCDGLADDDDTSATEVGSFHYDGDGDGYGDPAVAASSCDGGGVWLADATDCDDGDASDHVGAVESVGNGDDEDCDGGEICYADDDADGYRPSTGLTVTSADADCTDAGEALSTATIDCDDTTGSISPAATESCNRVDDDCDGATDEGVEATWYADTDGDGYGDAGATTAACALPSGYVASADDCDDTSALVYPGATEVCGDGSDNDCDDEPGDCGYGGDQAAATADVRLTGANASDQLGRGVALGDFDGDGDGDLLGGMPYYDTPAPTTGAAVVWYGPITASGTVSETASAVLTGSSSSAYVGQYVAAGDHDGDGADELVVGAEGMSSYAGAAYIVYGGSRYTGSRQISLVSGIATLTGGTASDYLGHNVASGGDMDGDGTEEIVVGAYLQSGSAASTGAAYLLYGSPTRRAGTTAASASDATVRGITAGAHLGYAVSFVDDMDGDGLDELLLGAYGTGASTGSAYLFLGDATHLSGTLSASTADKTYVGSATSDYAGYGVYDLNDLDGDGYADVGVHGYGYDSTAFSVGALWVYAGGTFLSTTATATLYGTTATDAFGEEAVSIGDQDGDGADDLLVGAGSQDTAASGAGAAYLFYGPVSGAIPASAADATFFGDTGGDGYFGRRLPDEPGDVTGDGVPDIVLGAWLDDGYVNDAGALYVWSGSGGE